MSKTARRCHLRRCRKPTQHPAILPWPSTSIERTGDHSTRLPKSAAVSLPMNGGQIRYPLQTREGIARYAQRRIPSRSINDL
jgi:hypothetical protein